MKHIVFGVVLVFLLAGVSLHADDIIQPHGGQWGDPSTSAESLLKMNRDPISIRNDEESEDPAHIHGSCTDSHGRTYQSGEPEYAPCMNLKIKMAKEAAKEQKSS
jgi:hypothetical protein